MERTRDFAELMPRGALSKVRLITIIFIFTITLLIILKNSSTRIDVHLVC
jgi:hypothetical protein